MKAQEKAQGHILFLERGMLLCYNESIVRRI